MMKKLFLILMAVFIGFSVNAQDVQMSQKAIKVQTTDLAPSETPVLKSPAPSMSNSFRDAILDENFDGVAAGTLPTGWTATETPVSGRVWNVGTVSGGSTSIPGHSGTQYAFILYHGSVAHDSWLFTPELTLTQDVPYSISFWVQLQGYNGTFEAMKAMIGTSATVAGMTTEIYNSSTVSHTSWQQVTYTFTPTTTGSYYIGFHSYSPADVNCSMIDDVSVTLAPTAPELEVLSVNTGTSLYTPITHLQNLLPSAVVKNNGADLTAAATLNFAVTPGTYSQDVTIATLNSNSSATFSVAETNGFSPTELGEYTLTASTDFADENMENNSLSTSFTATEDFFARDNGTYVGGVGSNSGTIIFGNLYELKTDDIVSAFSIAFSTNTSVTFTLRIYSVNEGLTTATQIYESEVFNKNVAPAGNTLTNFDIAPQALEAGKYLFCIFQNTATNIGCAYDGTAGGAFYMVNGTTGAITGQFGTSFGNIAVRIHCLGDISDVVDASVNAIIEPVTGLNLTATETVTAVIQNRGGSDISGFDLILNVDGNIVTETYTGTLASLETTEYTFTATADLSLAGDHLIKVIVDLDNDQDATNDTATVTINNTICDIIDQFTWEEDFESGAISPCWSMEYVTGTTNWTVRTGNGSTLGGILTAHSGTYNLSFYHTSLTTPATTKLILTPFDLTNLPNPALKFWHGQTAWGTDQDELRVYYKNSEDGEWTLLAEYTNNITEWTEEIISLPNVSANYYIAFEAYGTYGRGVVVDDISVLEFSDFVDASVLSVNAPSSGVNLGNETVIATVKNNSSDAISNFSLILNVNGTEIATETFTGTLASLEEVEYTFTATADLSADGEYTIEVVVDLTDDEVEANNSASITVTNTICNAITEFPWEENFSEPLTACWQNIDADGDGNGWFSATLDEEPVIASESRLVIIPGMLELPLTPDNYLITPQLALNDNYSLSFSIGAIAPNFAEKYSVLVSTTDANIESFTAIHTETLTAGGLNTVNLDLSDYNGETIYIAFRHWDCTNQYVLLLDNVKVSVAATPSVIDAAVVSVNSPASGENMGTETVKATIKNNGDDPISGFNVVLNVNGSDIATETYSGTLASAAQAEFTFAQTVDMTAAGNYTIKVTVALTGDQVESNNSAQIVVTNTVTNVSENELFLVNLYPNPAKQTVTLNNLPVNAMISVFDIAGKALKSFQAGETTVTMDIDFAAGTYFVKIESDGKSAVKKLIVQ